MQEIFDEYCWEDHKKVITFEKHHVTGLKNFAYWNLSRAIPPTPMHMHSNIVEIHCLTKGKRFCQIEDDVYTVTGNELFITFPFEPHNNGNFHQNPCSFYGIQVDLNTPDKLLGLNSEYSLVLYNILTNPGSRHVRFSPAETLLLKMAFEYIGEGTAESIQIGVQYLSCFLFKIPTFVPVRQEMKTTFDDDVKRALDFIEIHYREELHLKELAEIAGYSLSRFKIKFKEEIGMTPANYIIYKKLEFAKNLLTTTDYSITHIAMEAGFSSSNYFCTVLRKLSNFTPSDYRRVKNRVLAE